MCVRVFYSFQSFFLVYLCPCAYFFLFLGACVGGNSPPTKRAHRVSGHTNKKVVGLDPHNLPGAWKTLLQMFRVLGMGRLGKPKHQVRKQHAWEMRVHSIAPDGLCFARALLTAASKPSSDQKAVSVATNRDVIDATRKALDFVDEHSSKLALVYRGGHARLYQVCTHRVV